MAFCPILVTVPSGQASGCLFCLCPAEGPMSNTDHIMYFPIGHNAAQNNELKDCGAQGAFHSSAHPLMLILSEWGFRSVLYEVVCKSHNEEQGLYGGLSSYHTETPESVCAPS